ncbi:MAG: DUF4474 domain-containing protein [Roseburia sp.]|nr:DUF4474 domain-containing protein [Roseburia sp.]
MYLFIGCLLIFVLIFYLFFRFRKKKIRKILCNMTCEEKCDTLEPLIEPFGYCYDPSQDVFSTIIDAPQRTFGYTALFDRYASHFHMVFDCLPIYFDYQERTWLIELWKGQYGINLGCEVGIYKADSLVSTIWQKTALFHSVEDVEMLPISIRLFRNGCQISQLCRRHWWLTIFHMGKYSEPRDLSMQVCITFPNAEMLNAFTNALQKQDNLSFQVYGLQVQLLFESCTSCRLPFLQRFFCRFSQWKNRSLCRLFLWVTKPFCSSIDRLLCLYFFLPSVFRRIFRNKKRRKCHQKSCRKCNRTCKKH